MIFFMVHTGWVDLISFLEKMILAAETGRWLIKEIVCIGKWPIYERRGLNKIWNLTNIIRVNHSWFGIPFWGFISKSFLNKLRTRVSPVRYFIRQFPLRQRKRPKYAPTKNWDVSLVYSHYVIRMLEYNRDTQIYEMLAWLQNICYVLSERYIWHRHHQTFVIIFTRSVNAENNVALIH